MSLEWWRDPVDLPAEQGDPKERAEALFKSADDIPELMAALDGVEWTVHEWVREVALDKIVDEVLDAIDKDTSDGYTPDETRWELQFTSKDEQLRGFAARKAVDSVRFRGSNGYTAEIRTLLSQPQISKITEKLGITFAEIQSAIEAKVAFYAESAELGQAINDHADSEHAALEEVAARQSELTQVREAVESKEKALSTFVREHLDRYPDRRTKSGWKFEPQFLRQRIDYDLNGSDTKAVSQADIRKLWEVWVSYDEIIFALNSQIEWRGEQVATQLAQNYFANNPDKKQNLRWEFVRVQNNVMYNENSERDSSNLWMDEMEWINITGFSALMQEHNFDIDDLIAALNAGINWKPAETTQTEIFSATEPQWEEASERPAFVWSSLAWGLTSLLGGDNADTTAQAGEDNVGSYDTLPSGNGSVSSAEVADSDDWTLLVSGNPRRRPARPGEEGFVGPMSVQTEVTRWETTETVIDSEGSMLKEWQNVNIKLAWIQEHLDSISIPWFNQDKPRKSDIIAILQEYQDATISNANNKPEKSGKLIYALQVATGNPGIDGHYGPTTARYIGDYETANGLEKSWKLDSEAIRAIIVSLGWAVAPTPTTPVIADWRPDDAGRGDLEAVVSRMAEAEAPAEREIVEQSVVPAPEGGGVSSDYSTALQSGRVEEAPAIPTGWVELIDYVLVNGYTGVDQWKVQTEAINLESSNDPEVLKVLIDYYATKGETGAVIDLENRLNGMNI